MTTTTPCRTNPDAWFVTDPAAVAKAVDACQDCPLAAFNRCRQLGEAETFGVWGGVDRGAPREYPAALRVAAEARAEALTARDAEIVAAYTAGRKAASVAAEAGLSLRRVQQVVNDAGMVRPAPTTCASGRHERTEANTYRARGTGPKCRPCAAERTRERRAERATDPAWRARRAEQARAYRARKAAEDAA